MNAAHVQPRRLWWAHLASSSPRFEEWKHVFGTAEVSVPLKSPRPIAANLGDQPGTFRAEVYLLDTSALAPDQLQRLIGTVARKFLVDPREVEAQIANDGTFPIRAADVIVSFDMRAFL